MAQYASLHLVYLTCTKMYLWSKFVGCIPFNYLDELKQQVFFFYVQSSGNIGNGPHASRFSDVSVQQV